MTAPTAPRREELHETSIWDTDSNEITSRSQALRFDPRQAQAGKRRHAVWEGSELRGRGFPTLVGGDKDRVLVPKYRWKKQIALH